MDAGVWRTAYIAPEHDLCAFIVASAARLGDTWFIQTVSTRDVIPQSLSVKLFNTNCRDHTQSRLYNTQLVVLLQDRPRRLYNTRSTLTPCSYASTTWSSAYCSYRTPSGTGRYRYTAMQVSFLQTVSYTDNTSDSQLTSSPLWTVSIRRLPVRTTRWVTSLLADLHALHYIAPETMWTYYRSYYQLGTVRVWSEPAEDASLTEPAKLNCWPDAATGGKPKGRRSLNASAGRCRGRHTTTPVLYQRKHDF